MVQKHFFFFFWAQGYKTLRKKKKNLYIPFSQSLLTSDLGIIYPEKEQAIEICNDCTQHLEHLMALKK